MFLMMRSKMTMTYSTIYDTAGNVLTAGVRSQAVCDETITTARRIAADRKSLVVVEDCGTRMYYCVDPRGAKSPRPHGWVAVWETVKR